MVYAVGSESHQFMGQSLHPLLVRNLECSGREAAIFLCVVRQQSPQTDHGTVTVCPIGNEAGVRCAGMHYYLMTIFVHSSVCQVCHLL